MRKPRIMRSSTPRAAALAAGSLAAFAAASGGGAAAGDTAVSLSVTSSVPGAAAEVTCMVTVDGDLQEETRAGALPIELTLRGEAVDCTVTSDQPVRVVGTDSNGNRNQVQSSGGQIRLRLASGS